MLVWFVLLVLSTQGWAFNPYPRTQQFSPKAPNPGKRLVLTPYLKAGRVNEARQLALVPNLKGNVTSYAGFFTVDETCDSNMFFWFFPSTQDVKPLSVWLQGGPGATSLYGLLTENGPFYLTAEGNLKINKYSWTQASSYIYIDNPVGTGFSYTTQPSCYSTNQTQVGKHLLQVMQQFLVMFPEYKSSPLFVTGESYAGKYVPAFAHAIDEFNQGAGDSRINLEGVAIGNGLVDPRHQLIYSEYLYQLGLIDTNAREHFRGQEATCQQFIDKQDWNSSFYCFDSLLNGDLISGGSYFTNVTGFNFYFNYLYCDEPPGGDVGAFVNKPQIRNALHVGDATWHDGKQVEVHLKDDMMQSVLPWLEQLVEKYRVLIYNGQLDIIVAYPLTLGYLQQMKWSGAEKYKTASRYQWRVGKELAGYVKTCGNLTEVLVRNAGHMVPADQPRWALDLISRFVANKPFHAPPRQ